MPLLLEVPKIGGLLVIACLILKFLSDNTPAYKTPKSKRLTELPGGIPIFGNLIQMGDNHVRNLASWAEKYGPVFLVRLGKRV